MMAQNDQVVVGIDVAKDKVDACIRSLSQRHTFPNTAQGHRKMIAWLRKYRVGKAVMEASGGYEREWRNVPYNAGIEVRIVDPKRVRSFALSAGRLAKNDTIDAEMIAWFAETFSEAPHRSLMPRVRSRGAGESAQGPDRCQDPPAGSDEACGTRTGPEGLCACLEEPGHRNCQARGRNLGQGQGHAGFCRARRDHRECAGLRRNDICQPHCRDAGARTGERRDRGGIDRPRPL